MKIEVTQDDIDNGICKSYHSCPVALAVKRATHASLVKVLDCIVVNGQFISRNTLEVDDFITGFDYDGSGHPFSFELDYEVPSSDTFNWPCTD